MTDDQRELFLTDLWSLVVDEDELVDGQPSWIESFFRGTPAGEIPAGPTSAALHRVLAAGVDPDDLTDVVRTMQHEIIHNVCQLLDDPRMLGIRGERRWTLTVDGDPVDELHSSLDEHDPSGRHGEPRGRPVPARLPGQPLYARLAVAQARAGDRLAAVRTWRAATGDTTVAAKTAINALLGDASD
ncbi:hypothetical protein [Actinophytocola sp.]|uniref:hypothetical protein n=1 Tax=Actinophytocola sp. TaxID=1872138 RepID=UPI002ED18D0D